MARLRVDMVACEGIGQCVLVAPGLVGLDRWGYPVVLPAAGADAGSGAGERGDDAAARRAVRACPRHALWLAEAASAAPQGGRSR
jgi:ferredoxin